MRVFLVSTITIELKRILCLIGPNVTILDQASKYPSPLVYQILPITNSGA